jgi:hypothetical protein
MAQGKFRATREVPSPYAAYDKGIFKSVEGIYFDLENKDIPGLSGHWNILSWLQGRIAGFQVYNIRGILIPVMRQQPTTIYLDEMRIDAGVLNGLSVEDIALIKVMKSPGIWSGPGGAIAIYTKRGEGEEEED